MFSRRKSTYLKLILRSHYNLAHLNLLVGLCLQFQCMDTRWQARPNSWKTTYYFSSTHLVNPTILKTKKIFCFITFVCGGGHSTVQVQGIKLRPSRLLASPFPSWAISVALKIDILKILQGLPPLLNLVCSL